MVEEAERRRDAARTRVRVWRRRGRGGGVEGAPRRVRSWWEKVMKAGPRVSLVRCVGWSGVGVGFRRKTPPHCGMIQLVARLSLTTRGDCEGEGM